MKYLVSLLREENQTLVEGGKTDFFLSQMGGRSLKGHAFGLDAVLSYGSFAIRKTSPCPALVMTMRVMCLADLGGRF